MEEQYSGDKQTKSKPQKVMDPDERQKVIKKNAC